VRLSRAAADAGCADARFSSSVLSSDQFQFETVLARASLLAWYPVLRNVGVVSKGLLSYLQRHLVLSAVGAPLHQAFDGSSHGISVIGE
jgi:hypothetical protein